MVGSIMEQSRSVLSAQIQFIEERLSLVHIPIESYTHYVQALMQVLDPPAVEQPDIELGPQPGYGSVPWIKVHSFLNISITPLECSVVCSKILAKRFFLPAIERLSEPSKGTISAEDYVAISVVGEGMDAGQRVLDLSTPLAMAGISIFFFTTYFSDYILVPSKARNQVINALEARGFVFSESSHKYVNVATHNRTLSSSSGHYPSSPTTPPPASEIELQHRTMSLLRRKNVYPTVHSSMRLLQFAGRNDKVSRAGLEIGLMKCLVNPPKFFSLTLTHLESPSILICDDGLPNFGSESDSLLLGSKANYLMSFSFDLRDLPTEATGIVCGVSSKLVGSTTTGQFTDIVDMRYLSTYKGAVVIVEQEDLETAVELLRAGPTGLEVVRD